MIIEFSGTAGVWQLGDRQPAAEPYQTLVVELAGAVAEWSLTAPPGTLPSLTITDLAAADWLWRWLGEDAHIRLHAIAEHRSGPPSGELEVDLDGRAVQPLQRLAYGHWLRQWWPASELAGIPPLDRIVLDVELATLTLECADYLGTDGFDSAPEELLAGHSVEDLIAAAAVAAGPGPAADLMADLLAGLVARADELLPTWDERDLERLTQGLAQPVRVRADYALAAGGGEATITGAVATGTASIDWAGVPTGIFDAAEGTVAWAVDAAPRVELRLVCRVLPGGDPTGIPVRLSLPPEVEVRAEFDSSGRAIVPLEIPAATAWALRWQDLRCEVGALGDRGSTLRSASTRERVRRFAQERLAGGTGLPPFTAERVAATDDY